MALATGSPDPPVIGLGPHALALLNPSAAGSHRFVTPAEKGAQAKTNGENQQRATTPTIDRREHGSLKTRN